MSDPLLHEYKEYYAVRARRFEGNPNYRNSYEAEYNLSQAMQACSSLDEFKDRIGNLNELCATALIKDEHLMERAHYEQHQEHVRRLAADQILAKADACANVNELIAMVQEVSQQVGIEISVDEGHRQFQDDWSLLDDAEIYANAEVPDQYKAEMQERSAEICQEVAKGIVDLEEQFSSWKPGWRFDTRVINEYRHRHLIPFKDEHLQERLAEYQRIVNR